MIRVLVVDDHAIVRGGLAQLLGTADDLEVVGEARDGAEAGRLTASLLPDVILMDLSMPGMEGVEATRRAWAQAVVAFDLGVRWGRMPRRAQDVDQGRPGRDFPRVGRGSVVR